MFFMDHQFYNSVTFLNITTYFTIEKLSTPALAQSRAIIIGGSASVSTSHALTPPTVHTLASTCFYIFSGVEFSGRTPGLPRLRTPDSPLILKVSRKKKMENFKVLY